MLVPHDNERVRSYQVSSKTVRALISTGLFFTLLLTLFSVGFFVKQAHHVRAAQLRKTNELLAAEVDQMRGQMQQLNESIQALAHKDEQYRVLAGLPEARGEAKQGAPGSVSEAALRHLSPETGGKVAATSEDLETLMRRAATLQSSMDDALAQLARNRERLASTPSIAPANGHLSSLFGTRRHPVLRITRPHKGVDIAARVGEPIMAPARGRVVFAGNGRNGYGNMVEIDHGYGYVTRFAHASRLLVRTGQEVKRGDVIARVGATGLVSGPHLHYEVEVNGRQVDPLNFIIADAIPD